MFETTLAWLESYYTPGRMIIFFALMFLVGIGGSSAKYFGKKGATYKNSGLMILLAYLVFRFAPEHGDLSLLLIALGILVFIFRRRKKDDG